MKIAPMIALLLATVPAAALAQPPSAQQVLDSAAAALGGADAVRGARTLELDGAGKTWWLGQALTSEGSREMEIAKFEQRYDLGQRRIRTTSAMPFYGFLVEVTMAADGDVAFSVDEQGNAQRINEAPGAGRPPGYETPITLRDELLDQSLAFYHHPLPLVRAALAGDTVRVTNVREDGEEYALDMITPAGALTLRVGKQDGLPHSVSSRDYLSIIGDAAIVTTFSDYANAGGLRLPGRIRQSTDARWPAVDLKVTNTVNGDVGNLAAPAAVRSAEVPDLPPADVVDTLVAPGVWQLAGNANHFSMLVEFPSYAVLLEAPVSDRRTLAVIAKARALVNGKPLRYLVNTHYHFDHSGGVRAAVANGLTVITHELNRDFYRELVQRPHIVRPDYLALHPAPLQMITVKADQTYELSEGNRRLVIYPNTASKHADGMLMAYLPNEGILYQADLFSLGAEDTEGIFVNLLSNIRQRGLPVKTIVAAHGDISTLKDLEAAAAASGF